MTLPTVTIVVTTYLPSGGRKERLAAFTQAIRSWGANLRYDGPLRIHIADDGSVDSFWPNNAEELIDRHWVGHPQLTTSRQERRGVGASLNTAFRAAHARDDGAGIALYVVDDWELLRRYDLTPWVQLLLDDESVGMVRLGPPHPWLTGRIETFPSGWGMRLDRHHFAFGHRPALYHPRMVEAYGAFPENVNAYECERMYAEMWAARGPADPGFRYLIGETEVRGPQTFARDATSGAWLAIPGPDGPDIVLALTEEWRHVDSIELADIEPGEAIRG